MENNSFSQVINPSDLPRPQGFITKPVKGKKSKGKIRRKIYFTLIGLLIALLAILYATYKINQFFEAKHIIFQSPVHVQWPVKVENRTVTQRQQIEPINEAQASGPEEVSVKAPDVIPVPARSSTAEIVDKIWALESSRTNSQGCKAKGQYNGYGYIPGNCYKSHAEVTSLVTAWVEKHSYMGIATMLCYYNQGKVLSTCEYYRNYLALR